MFKDPQVNKKNDSISIEELMFDPEAFISEFTGRKQKGGKCGRVVVAMSGGVDSSVSALLLQHAGFEVVGVTMRLFDKTLLSDPAAKLGDAFRAVPHEIPSELKAERASSVQAALTCSCSSSDIEDARRVCEKLGIKHYVVDYAENFAQKVVEPFCAAYEQGLTPNPCVECNRYLKLASLNAFREELGFDYLATGHYVRSVYDEKSKKFQLHKALFQKKDQSYVLYHLNQDILSHMIFPLGELPKDKVRALAGEESFENAQKKESMDICFIPDGDYVSFIKRLRGHDFEPGDIFDANGNKLGRHMGIVCYTIGQRKGLGIAAAEPLYVIHKDAQHNALVVGKREDLFVTHMEARRPSFIDGDMLTTPRRVQAKTGYRSGALEASAYCAQVENEQGENEWRLFVDFDEAVTSTSPGQSLVLYDGTRTLGGGIIVSAS